VSLICRAIDPLEPVELCICPNSKLEAGMLQKPTLHRHRNRKLPWLTWTFLSLSGLSVLPASALECPLAQSTTQPGALRESRQTIAMRARTLESRGSAAIPSIIFSLRSKYPHSTDAEITNYLITAYCPVLNREPALTDNQKRASLERFADQVRARLN
jgi:hypothetical protein